MNPKNGSTQLSDKKWLLLFACYSFGSWAIGLGLGRAILLSIYPGSASLLGIFFICIAFMGGMLHCWRSLPENRPDPKDVLIRIGMFGALVVWGSILRIHRFNWSDMKFPEGLLFMMGLVLFLMGAFADRRTHKSRHTVSKENAG